MEENKGKRIGVIGHVGEGKIASASLRLAQVDPHVTVVVPGKDIPKENVFKVKPLPWLDSVGMTSTYPPSKRGSNLTPKKKKRKK